MRIVHHSNLRQWSNNYLNTLISTVVVPRHFCYMNFADPLIWMTALQICGMVNDPSAQVRQKQYEMPDNLPDDLTTILVVVVIVDSFNLVTISFPYS